MFLSPAFPNSEPGGCEFILIIIKRPNLNNGSQPHHDYASAICAEGTDVHILDVLYGVTMRISGD